MQIFEAIRKDHERQRLLMKILVETSGATKPRKEYFQDLKKQLAQHAIAEERTLYAPLLMSDKTIDESRHAIAEHHQIDKLIEKLEETDMSSPVWLKLMKELQDKVEHHLAEEENDFFKKAGELLSVSEKEKLANDYNDEMKAIIE